MQSTYEELMSAEHVMDYTKPRCGNVLPWETKKYQQEHCMGDMVFDKITGDIIVRGNVGVQGVDKVMFWAAAPPTYSMSFSGSAMPYPNPVVAFDRTPNRGVVQVGAGGAFEFRIKYPNAYYVGLGSLYIPPHVNMKLCIAGRQENDPANKTVTVKIDEGIPFRLLTYPAPPSKKPRVNAMFYCEPCQGARTQEAILRASGYPETNITPDNFWGTRPPR